jgi:hypothetical protein
VSGMPYEVGVRLVMTSNHAGILAGLSQALLGIHPAINQLQDKFSSLKVAIGGAAAAWAGDKILGSMDAIIRKTADLSHALTD